MIFGYPRCGWANSDITAMEVMLGGVGREIHSEKDLDGVHLFLLFGGEDISPYYYGEKATYADASNMPSRRDMEEALLFNLCIERKIPVLGICRGAQFACALLGGKLWQHVDGHAGRDHPITVDGKGYRTNSYHHQMMRPSMEMEVLGSSPCLSPIKYTESGPIVDEGDEAEIVYHRSKKVLMIQGHPEWVTPKHPLYNLTQSLVKEYLCNW